MEIFIVAIILLVLSFVSIIISIIIQIDYRKRYINIFENNVIERLLNFNYDSLEIKRKIQFYSPRHPRNFKEIPLEMECHHSFVVSINADIIEVYGKTNKSEYLIYKKNWSREDAENVKAIVNVINSKMKCLS